MNNKKIGIIAIAGFISVVLYSILSITRTNSTSNIQEPSALSSREFDNLYKKSLENRKAIRNQIPDNFFVSLKSLAAPTTQVDKSAPWVDPSLLRSDAIEESTVKCLNGEIQACQDLSDLYKNTGNRLEAGYFSRLQCEFERSHQILSCLDAGKLSSWDTVKEDVARCKSGDERSCFVWLGYRFANEGISGIEAYKTTLKRHCEQGTLDACVAIVSFLDIADAIASSEDCTKGSAASCALMGEYTRKDNSNIKLARDFFMKSCNLGAVDACFKFGEAVTNEDYEALKSECLKGNPALCRLAMGAAGARKLRNETIKFGQIACLNNFIEACDRIKNRAN